jgi:hypothetical protein
LNLSSVATANPCRLVDLDQMETSELSRRLDPWKPVKAERGKPLITHVLSNHGAYSKPENGEW